MSCSLEDVNGYVLYSKRRDVQLSKLNGLDAHFSSTHTEVCRVKARLASLETAVQKAKKVRSVPFLELYSDWQQVCEYEMFCVPGLLKPFGSMGVNLSEDS